MVTSPRHVPPIVEQYPPGSAAHAVRGQMSPRPLTQVTTHQPLAFNLNKHWNKLRGGGEKERERMTWQNWLNISALSHDSSRYQTYVSVVLQAFCVQITVGSVQYDGESLPMLQYVSLLWRRTTLWRISHFTWTWLEVWHKNAEYGNVLVP